MRHRQSNGVEISGFIDYVENLRKTILEFDEVVTDWYEIFMETKRIEPKKDDLGSVFYLKMEIMGKILYNSIPLPDITIGAQASQFSMTQKTSKQSPIRKKVWSLRAGMIDIEFT